MNKNNTINGIIIRVVKHLSSGSGDEHEKKYKKKKTMIAISKTARPLTPRTENVWTHWGETFR